MRETRGVSPAMQQALLSTLAYADIFDQPLTLDEIQRYFPFAASSADLCSLIGQSGPEVERAGPYFVLPGRSATLETRARRSAASRRMWRRARPVMHFLAALPFIRMLALTGSLAIQSAEPADDLDLFVVTAQGRLWIGRALILLVARIVRPLGIRLCPNYLVSERALGLPDRSLYTARELVQMVPLSGFAIYDRMRGLNAWSGDYLPNAGGPPASSMRLRGLRALELVQRFAENLLRFAPLRIVEQYEMRRKVRILEREQGLSPEAHFSAEVCKGHGSRHASRIERRLRERLRELGPAEVSPDVVIQG